MAAVEVAPEGSPAELSDPSHAVWATPEGTRRWLERHRLVRRLRALGPMEQMTPSELHRHAVTLWTNRQEEASHG